MNKILSGLIKRYKKIQQTKFLNAPLDGQQHFAIVGAGQHATTHLYPCLWHLGAPVRKICTVHEATAVKAALRFPECKGTTRLEDILQDQTIRGVIVCTDPGAHPEICSRLLKAGKQVFVEKPLGKTSEELAAVQANASDKVLMVGLQRRFSPLAQKISNKLKDPISYHYQFRVGAYPEGDAVYDLFIHPVDFAISLFGKAAVRHCTLLKNGSGLTVNLILDHGNCTGNLELSTHYSWKFCSEELTICQQDGIIRSSYPSSLTYEKKQASMMGLPLEKLGSKGRSLEILLQPNDFNPIATNNSLVQMGFYPALELFVQRVRSGSANQQEQQELQAVYRILDQISISAGKPD